MQNEVTNIKDIPLDFIVKSLTFNQKYSICQRFDIINEYKVRRQNERRHIIIKDLATYYNTSHNNIESIINRFSKC